MGMSSVFGCLWKSFFKFTARSLPSWVEGWKKHVIVPFWNAKCLHSPTLSNFLLNNSIDVHPWLRKPKTLISWRCIIWGLQLKAWSINFMMETMPGICASGCWLFGCWGVQCCCWYLPCCWCRRCSSSSSSSYSSSSYSSSSYSSSYSSSCCCCGCSCLLYSTKCWNYDTHNHSKSNSKAEKQKANTEKHHTKKNR